MQPQCTPQITEDIATPRRESDITAWVNAIYGCNEKCTYCVVPYTRWGRGWACLLGRLGAGAIK